MTTAPLPRLTREPNVVPMIDVLLVLLIIFMIASASQRRALDLQLPQQSSGGASGPSIVLTVDPGPRYALNGTVIDASRLGAELTRAFRDRPEKILFIDGARTVAYQDVFWIYGAVRDAGIRVTAIVPAGTRRPGASLTSPARP